MLAVALTLSACSTPDLSAEVGTFSNAVTDVSSEYRSALAIGPSTIREGQIAAVVRDRKKVVQLSEGCDAIGTGDERYSVESCVVDDERVLPDEGSVARAAVQLDILADYFAALETLATARTATDVENAAAAATGSITELAKATGAGSVAKALSSRREAIGKAAGFAIEQYRYSRLRSVVRNADLPIARLLLDLQDTAIAHGQKDPKAAYDALRTAQDEMDAAKASGSDASYEAKVRAFYAAYDDFTVFRRRGLVPRLSMIRETHGALRDRLNAGASVAEILTLIDKLKAIDGGFK
jgi:hypothetical protein